VLTLGQDALLAASGSHLIVEVQQSGGQLKGLRSDGTVETLGSIGTDNPSRFVASPDGNRWLWGTSALSGQTITSKVEEAGTALSPRVVAQQTEENHELVPFAWSRVAPTIFNSPVGIGGYILFSPAYGPAQRLDPDAFRLASLATPAGCQFSDLSADGTIVCVTQRNDRPSVTIVPPNGAARVIALSLPRFTLVGDAYFSPDGKLLTVAGAEGRGMQPDGGPERYGVDLITVADGSIRRFGPDGLRPSESLGAASWLPDGSLVLWRPENAGGDPGTYVVSPDGHAVKISAYGPPSGVLTS
jgi:hypothetical protein